MIQVKGFFLIKLNLEIKLNLLEFKSKIIFGHKELMSFAFLSGPKFSLTREDVSLGMRRKVSEWTYIVGCHYDEKTDQVKLNLSFFTKPIHVIIILWKS